MTAPICKCHRKPMVWKNHRYRCRVPIQANQRLQNTYGITLDDYEAMVENQLGGCAICGSILSKLVVDHCHASGAVRGLLCNHCNSGLGFFKDKPWRLRQAAMYLESARVDQLLPEDSLAKAFKSQNPEALDKTINTSLEGRIHMKANWKKLNDGSWGVRVQLETPFEKVAVGDTLTVTKKSGESKDHVVESVIWEGEDSYAEAAGARAAIVKVARPWDTREAT